MVYKGCAELLLSGVQFLTDTGIYPWTNEDLKRRIRTFPSLIEQQLKAVRGSFKFNVKVTFGGEETRVEYGGKAEVHDRNGNSASVEATRDSKSGETTVEVSGKCKN